MLDRQAAATEIIGGDHVGIFQPGFPVEIDNGRSALADSTKQFEITAGRAIDEAGHFPVQEHRERSLFFVRVFIGVANQDGVTIGSSDVLD